MHEIVLNGYTAQHSSNRCLSLGTAESYGIEKIHITAGPGWEDMLIKAVFHPPSGEAVAALIGEDGIIDVPPEATAVSAGEYNPGVIVFSGVADGTQRISANLAYTVIGHAPVDGKDSEPTPSQWEQLAAQYQSKVDKQQGAENAGKVLGIGEDGLVRPGTGEKEVFWVKLDTKNLKCDHTPEEILDAASKGLLVVGHDMDEDQYCYCVGKSLTHASFERYSSLDEEVYGRVRPGILVYRYDVNPGKNLKVKYDHVVSHEKLPNPYAITFKGAASGSYDGSAPLTLEIPEGGSGDGSVSGLSAELKTALKIYFTNIQTLFTQLSFSTSDHIGGTLIDNARNIVTALENGGSVEEPEQPESGIVQTGSVLAITSGVTVTQNGSILAIA